VLDLHRAYPVEALAVMIFYFAAKPTRWQRIKIRFTWHYIRQTRPLLPLTEWWLNRG
jgi:hypothetical protein